MEVADLPDEAREVQSASLYHIQTALVPRLPPVGVITLDVPTQALLFVMLIAVAAVDRVFIDKVDEFDVAAGEQLPLIIHLY